MMRVVASGRERDRGLILPMVLVISVVLSVVVIGVAKYGTANLRYSQVTERRSDQLAAADAAMSYAVNLLRIGAASCIFNDQTIDLPPLAESFNGATGSVTCSQTGGGLDSASEFAMAITGQGLATVTNVDGIKLSDDYLVSTSEGSVKTIGGPMFMERVDADAFELANNKGLLFKKAPLLHYDGTSPQCQAISENVLDDDVDFEPDALFGPICTGDHWYDYGPGGATFDEPPINISFDPQWSDSVTSLSGGAMPVYHGGQPATYTTTMPLTTDAADANKTVTVQGGYTDVGNCRVFEPGRYIRPPDVANAPKTPPNPSNVYFKSGDYLFDFRTPSGTPASFRSWAYASITNSEFQLDKTIATAGKLDLAVGITAAITNAGCQTQIDADPNYGVTFYMSGKAQFALNTQAVIEIMPRNQNLSGDPLYVGIHALCDRSNSADTAWCKNSPNYSAPTLQPPPSDRQAPSNPSSNPALVWIKAGNNSEIVSNALIYAPRAELEFRNVTNDAEVRIRGGVVVARATIDASASAENFEIGIGDQNIDLDFYLTATGTDTEGGSTKIVSDVDFHYDETDLDRRIDIFSWRVCETAASC